LLTCSSISVLSDITASAKEPIALGVGWLRSIQRADGGWGPQERADSTVFHTAKTLNTLVDIGSGLNDPNVHEGLTYIQSNWSLESDNYIEEIYEIKNDISYSRIMLDHDTDAEVVRLLLRLMPDWSYKHIDEALKAFVSSYRHNGLKHPTKQRESIWTIIPRAIAIHAALRKLPFVTNGTMHVVSDLFIISPKSNESFGILLCRISWYIVRYIFRKRILLYFTIVAAVSYFVYFLATGSLTSTEVALGIVVPLIIFLLGLKTNKPN